jgi:tRNA (cmo5U34)-methyltransferase
MSVAGHLRIDLDQYDHRIRTFIPRYDEMLDAAASLVSPRARVIVDLGIGTGALAARCLARAPRARVIGIDADREILALARRRLRGRATLVPASFVHASLPRADAFVASLALHHVRTRESKARLYDKLFRAVRPGGFVITADAHPAGTRSLAAAQHAIWRAHLRRSYTNAQTDTFFRSWAQEDKYMPLDAELQLMERGGFSADVAWRNGIFAILTGWRPAPQTRRL